MVAVVGGPAQGQLTEVAGADDQAPPLVGQVHEDLRALPGLGVLKGDGLVLHGLADVGEVLFHRLADIDLHEIRAQLHGQQFRVGTGAFGGAEAGHGDGQDALPVPAQHIEGQGGNQDGKGGVQPAGQPHHGAGGVGVLQPLLEAQGGDGQNFLAALRPVPRVRRDEGGGGDGAGEGGFLNLQ